MPPRLSVAFAESHTGKNKDVPIRWRHGGHLLQVELTLEQYGN